MSIYCITNKPHHMYRANSPFIVAFSAGSKCASSGVKELGRLYYIQDKLEEAMWSFQQALHIQQKAIGDVHPTTANFK